MNGARIFQLHVGISQRQLGKSGVHDDFLRHFQFACHADVSVSHAVTVKLSDMQSGHQEWIQVDVCNRNFSVQGVRISQSKPYFARNPPRGHRRTKLQLRRASVGCQTAVEASNHILTDAEVHHSECPLALWCTNGTVCLETKCDKSSDR